MRARQLITIAVVSTLLFGGMAALGAASPPDQAPDNTTDAHEENAPKDVDAADRASGNGAGNADGVGPSDGLPEQVPDHVSEIHDRINSFLNGSIDDLGSSLSELLGDGEAGDETAADDDGDTAEEATEIADADESTDDKDADT
jgi:hypothetical protein